MFFISLHSYKNRNCSTINEVGAVMSRIEFCEKDGILITYTDENVCFENLSTAESVLISNNGDIIHSNFDEEKNEYFKGYLKQIYPAITTYRNLDVLETA